MHRPCQYRKNYGSNCDGREYLQREWTSWRARWRNQSQKQWTSWKSRQRRKIRGRGVSKRRHVYMVLTVGCGHHCNERYWSRSQVLTAPTVPAVRSSTSMDIYINTEIASERIIARPKLTLPKQVQHLTVLNAVA